VGRPRELRVAAGRVPRDGVAGVEGPSDAVDARRERPRDDEVGVGVRAPDAVLDPCRPRRDPNRRHPVVESPRGRVRREAVGVEPLVRVQRGRVERGQGVGVLQDAGDERPPGLREPVGGVERVLVPVERAHVEVVAVTALPSERFGHERGLVAGPLRGRLDEALEVERRVGLGERGAVVEQHFELSGAVLVLERLYRHVVRAPPLEQPVVERAHRLGRPRDPLVLVVGHRFVAVALLGPVEQGELQFAPDEELDVEVDVVQHRLEGRPWVHTDDLALVLDVTEDAHGVVPPGDRFARRRLRVETTVAVLDLLAEPRPGRDVVARRLDQHQHVDGEPLAPRLAEVVRRDLFRPGDPVDVRELQVDVPDAVQRAVER